jgi:hypothetical protein
MPGLETAKTINLKSLIIGNGFYDPKTQYPAYYKFIVSPGNTYDFSPYNSTLLPRSGLYIARYLAGRAPAVRPHLSTTSVAEPTVLLGMPAEASAAILSTQYRVHLTYFHQYTRANAKRQLCCPQGTTARDGVCCAPGQIIVDGLCCALGNVVCNG